MVVGQLVPDWLWLAGPAYALGVMGHEWMGVLDVGLLPLLVVGVEAQEAEVA